MTDRGSSVTRYPLEPLAAAAGLTVAEVLKRCGCAGGQWVKYREEGISEKTADRYAVRLGLLPSDVWRSWYDDQLVECAEDGCAARFAPSNAVHRFCSQGCADRNRGRRYRRRRYQTDPTYRAAELERVRAYKAEHRKGLLRQRRAERQRRMAA